MAKEKFYVVWEGVTPGVYASWTDCQLQIKGYEGAKYKSFDTREEAERALASSPYAYIGKNAKKKTEAARTGSDTLPASVIDNSLAVDAACSGNPGPMEYRGVHVASRQEIFHFGPMKGTNNIGEFLAIVHGLALLKQKGFDMPIYSDSVNAISWVRQKKCKTKLPRNEETEELFKRVKATRDICELRNMINVGYLITRQAIERKESRGLHYTIDYPKHAYDQN